MTRFNSYLQKKIKENMREWKEGRWVSQKQALAVSYSQARKKYPRNIRSRKQRSRSKPKKQRSRSKPKKQRSTAKKQRSRSKPKK